MKLIKKIDRLIRFKDDPRLIIQCRIPNKMCIKTQSLYSTYVS